MLKICTCAEPCTSKDLETRTVFMLFHCLTLKYLVIFSYVKDTIFMLLFGMVDHTVFQTTFMYMSRLIASFYLWNWFRINSGKYKFIFNLCSHLFLLPVFLKTNSTWNLTKPITVFHWKKRKHILELCTDLLKPAHWLCSKCWEMSKFDFFF